MTFSKPACLAILTGLVLSTLGSAEPLNTQRRVSGIITGLEPGTVTICAIDGKHTTTGRIDAAKTRILDDGVQKCVMNVIKAMKFPESPRGFETRASYPFNFHPKNAPAGKP